MKVISGARMWGKILQITSFALHLTLFYRSPLESENGMSLA